MGHVKWTVLAAISACIIIGSANAQSGNASPDEVRAITKEAYIYGFPLVDSYRIQHAYFVDTKNPEYRAPWNQLINTPRVYTPADTAIQTPNSDTPYSWLGLDLRAEPMVLTLPKIDKSRYFSVQFIDAYTFNFAYLGSRTTGNDGGIFLIAGPAWKGKTPKGIEKVIHSETDFDWAVYRTQLFNPDDLDNVKKVQAGYKAEPLSEYLHTAPAAVPPIDFIQALTPDEERKSLKFFNVLNFVLDHSKIDPSEKGLMARFAKIGVGPGQTFDESKLSPEAKTAMDGGITDAWADLATLQKDKIDTGKVTSGDILGDRATLKGNYLYRMAGTVLGIGGNSKQEAMYPVYSVDADGQRLTGANNYTIHFAAGQLPPVHSFWSLTMYELPKSLLVANPINRYLINSPMLPQLIKDPDGGITLYVQNSSPGKDKEANWLPAPQGPFIAFMRLYWPKQTALDGKWKQPPLTKAQ